MDHREWIERYGQAWRAKDAVAVTNLFTDDAIYRSTPTGAAHIGSTAIAAYWRRATVSQNQLELRFGTPVVADQRIAVEWWATPPIPTGTGMQSTTWRLCPGARP